MAPPVLLDNPLFSAPTSSLTPDQDALRWNSLKRALQQIQQQLGMTVRYGAPSAPGGSEISSQTIRTGKILGPTGSTVSTIVMDLQTQLVQIFDSNGTVRVEMGNLAARGVSAAQFGLRVNDASAVPFFDTLGVLGLPKLLASGGANWTATNVVGVAGPPTGISGTGGEVVLTSFNFTLSRTATVCLVPIATAYKQVTLGPIGLLSPIYPRVTGQANGPAGGVAVAAALGGAVAPTSTTPVQVLSNLPEATYTANLIWNSMEGANCNLTYYTNLLYVFQFGS